MSLACLHNRHIKADENIQGDQKVSVHLTITVQKKTDDFKMAITEYIWNVHRTILNMVFKNTVRRVNKCLDTGGGTLNRTWKFLYCNHQVHSDFLITLYKELGYEDHCKLLMHKPGITPPPTRKQIFTSVSSSP